MVVRVRVGVLGRYTVKKRKKTYKNEPTSDPEKLWPIELTEPVPEILQKKGITGISHNIPPDKKLEIPGSLLFAFLGKEVMEKLAKAHAKGKAKTRGGKYLQEQELYKTLGSALIRENYDKEIIEQYRKLWISLGQHDRRPCPLCFAKGETTSYLVALPEKNGVEPVKCEQCKAIYSKEAS